MDLYGMGTSLASIRGKCKSQVVDNAGFPSLCRERKILLVAWLVGWLDDLGWNYHLGFGLIFTG